MEARQRPGVGRVLLEPVWLCRCVCGLQTLQDATHAPVDAFVAVDYSRDADLSNEVANIPPEFAEPSVGGVSSAPEPSRRARKRALQRRLARWPWPLRMVVSLPHYRAHRHLAPSR